MPIGHLHLGLALAGKRIPVFLACGSSARLGANRQSGVLQDVQVDAGFPVVYIFTKLKGEL